MKKTSVKLFLILCLIFFSSKGFSSENAKSFYNGIKNYNNGKYEQAVNNFLFVANKNIKNGKLFYNIGNSYFNKNELGQAILWYERALKLIPNDPDLKFNINYARTFIKDKNENKPSPFYNIIFFWKNIFSITTIQILSIILFSIFWILSAVYYVKKYYILKLPTIILFTISIIFITTSFFNFYNENYIKTGVIISEKVSIRSGLSDNSTELFILHAGTKVIIKDTKHNFLKIYFSKGKIGWIRKQDIKII